MKYPEVLVISRGAADCEFEDFKMMAVCADSLLHCVGNDIRRIFEGSTPISTENRNVIFVCRRNVQNSAHPLYVKLMKRLITVSDTLVPVTVRA